MLSSVVKTLMQRSFKIWAILFENTEILLFYSFSMNNKETKPFADFKDYSCCITSTLMHLAASSS